MVNTIPLERLPANTMIWHNTFGFLLTICLLVCLHGPVRAEVFSDSLDSEQYQRSYIVYLPEGVRSGERLPTVIALHGPLMSGKSMRRLFGLEEVADRERFAIVYPDGQGRRWNDGRVVDESAPDDVRFITALAKRLVNEEIADPKRIYLLGMATGGMLTYRIACEAPETFSAYAAIVADMPKRIARRCRSQIPVPMLMINSAARVDISAGSEAAEWLEAQNNTLTGEENVEFWRQNNGCEGPPQTRTMPDKDPSDGSTVSAEQYPNCENGAPVVSFNVEGGGRLPPGVRVAKDSALLSVLGRPNQDISAAAISWKFFKRFAKGRFMSGGQEAPR